MTQRHIIYTLEVLQEEMRQAESESRDVELSLPTAETILDLLEEAGYGETHPHGLHPALQVREEQGAGEVSQKAAFASINW